MARVLLFIFFIGLLHKGLAQTVPITSNLFFSSIKPNNKLPEKLLSGRTVLIFTPEINEKDLIQIQKQFAETGIDAVQAVEFHLVFGGQDNSEISLQQFIKREIHNLCFIQKRMNVYILTLASFTGTRKWIHTGAVWQSSSSSLYELLLQLNREALNTFQKKNLLISESPDIQSELKLINGSRVEAFTADLKVDRVAVRLSGRNEEDALLKEICLLYPFKIEFVSDSISDAQLRQKGFWYVLHATSGKASLIKNLLGYADKTKPAIANTEIETQYKFYLKKLEFDIFYLGKTWDASAYWPQALENYLKAIRKEFNVP